MITKILDEMALSRKFKNASKTIDFDDYFKYCTKINPNDIECIQQFVSNSGSSSTFISDIYIPGFLNYIGVLEPVKMAINRLNKLTTGLYTKMENVSDNHLSYLNDFINSFVKLITNGIELTDILYDNIIGFYSELKQLNIENGFEFNNERLKQTSDSRRRYVCDFINGRIVLTTNSSYQWISWISLSSVFKDVAIIVNKEVNRPYGYFGLESYKSNIKELMLVFLSGLIAQWRTNTTISDSLSDYENYGFSIKEENGYSSVKRYICEKKLNINSQSFSVIVYVEDHDTYIYNSCMCIK